MSATCQCPQNCGRPIHGNGYSKTCGERWKRAGRPESGPPAPKGKAATVCVNCCQPRKRRATEKAWEGGYNLCRACYTRWSRAGRPATGVPAPKDPLEVLPRARALSAVAKRERMAERMEEYAFLRSLGFTLEQAASDVGVGVDWAEDAYEPAYRRAVRGQAA